VLDVGARRIFTVLLLAVAAFTISGHLSANAQVRHPRVVALDWAYTQAGVPYVWGGDSGWGYDCSGLVKAAYEHVGIDLPHQTVWMLYSGHLRWTDHPRPGDLVMWGGWYPYHVELYVRPGWSWGAQDFGTVVGMHQIWGYPQYYEVVG
jgi:cell wall-associated NlpC family hydrolase